MTTCPDCDGTGEVHSHNPKCPSCGGKGVVTEERAVELREQNKRLEQSSGRYRGIPSF